MTKRITLSSGNGISFMVGLALLLTLLGFLEPAVKTVHGEGYTEHSFHLNWE